MSFNKENRLCYLCLIWQGAMLVLHCLLEQLYTHNKLWKLAIIPIRCLRINLNNSRLNSGDTPSEIMKTWKLKFQACLCLNKFQQWSTCQLPPWAIEFIFNIHFPTWKSHYINMSKSVKHATLHSISNPVLLQFSVHVEATYFWKLALVNQLTII